MANGNCTYPVRLYHGVGGLCGTYELWALLGGTALLFLASLLGNMVCCFQRSKKNQDVRFPQHFRTSVKSTVENPVYGNLNFLQTGLLSNGEDTAKLEVPDPHAPGPQKVCYANLKLNPAVVQQEADAGIQYADVVMLAKEQSEPEAQGKDVRKPKRAPRETTQHGDQLYASVQTDRYKTRFEDQKYANNS